MLRCNRSRKRGVSPLISVIVLALVVLVGGSAVYGVFVSNMHALGSRNSVAVSSVGLVKSSDGAVTFACTVKNIGATPATSLTIKLGSEQPAAFPDVNPNTPLPSGHTAQITLTTKNGLSRSYVSGQIYAYTITSLSKNGADAITSTVTCTGSGPPTTNPTPQNTPTPSDAPNPTSAPSSTPTPTPSPSSSTSQPATPTTQTYHFGSSTNTVNTITANALQTTQPNRQASLVFTHSQGWVYHWGIRVFQLAADGSETELTQGSPVAIATVGTNSQGQLITGTYIETATWTAPQTTLAPSDAIVIKVYYECSGTAWTQAGQWTTPQLGAASLNSQTWTINYYLSQSWYYSNNDDQYHYRSSFTWGTPTYNSCIKNFTWTPP